MAMTQIRVPVWDHTFLVLGGRLNSRHGRETHGITVGTQENRISRHRQISQHKKQITMGTAHSSHPITSPNLNKTMRALWKTTRKSIRKEHSENQITMGTAHSSHPMTSSSLLLFSSLLFIFPNSRKFDS